MTYLQRHFNTKKTRERRQMIVTSGGIKGGAGKSLIATNLCVLSAREGKKVLLVDADEQGSTGDWVEHRLSLGITTPWTTIRLRATAVRTEVLKMAADYDQIIIDCGGRDTVSLRAALTISHLFLVPIKPMSFDIWTIAKVLELVEEAKALNTQLTAYTFINCAVARGNDNDEAQKILAKAEGLSLLPVTIGLRKAFSNATALGLGIVEMNNDPKAVSEMYALYNSIFNKQQVLKTQKTSQKHVSPMI